MVSRSKMTISVIAIQLVRKGSAPNMGTESQKKGCSCFLQGAQGCLSAYGQWQTCLQLTVYALRQQCAYNWTIAVAEDVLLVLEQQAHSAVSQQPSPASPEVPSAPSTSSQHPSAASVSPVSSPGTLPDSSPPTQGAAPKSLHSDSTIIPLRGYKRAMVKSMVKAGAIPHFHLCDELDMRAMMSLRHRIKDDSVLQGVHLTFLPVMIKVHVCSKH